MFSLPVPIRVLAGGGFAAQPDLNEVLPCTFGGDFN